MADRTVIGLSTARTRYARRQARADLEALAAEAMTALADVAAGDVAAIYAAHRAVGRAVRVTMAFALDLEGVA